MFGAHAAKQSAGTVTTMPMISRSLRPYRSPTAPKYSTEAASPSE
jgi:hypothetical protein